MQIDNELYYRFVVNKWGVWRWVLCYIVPAVLRDSVYIMQRLYLNLI